MGAGLEHAPDQVVDQTAARVADDHVQGRHGHKGDTAHNCMEHKQLGSHKHERELQRFSDAGYHAGRHAGDHQGFHFLLFLRRRGTVNGQSRSGKSEHHHGHLSLAQENGVGSQLADVHLVNELEENVQAAFHSLVHAADGRGTEDSVQHVVQAGRDQKSLQESVSKHSHQAGCGNHAAQAGDGHGNGTPHNRSDQTNHCGNHNHGDGHKPLPAVERYGHRECDLMVFIMYLGRHQTDDNAGHRAHVQSFHAQDIGNFQSAEIHKPGIDQAGRRHQKRIVSDKSCKRRDLFFLSRQAESNGNGKQHRKQGKYHVGNFI